MAKNLVNGTNVVIEENGDNINMNLSSAYNTNLQQEINDSFKENNTYSTTEAIIGTWIDNKPLYRKAYIENDPTTGTWAYISLDNTYNIKMYKGFYQRANNNLDALSAGREDYTPLICTIRNNQIEYKIDSTYASGKISVYFILEYTKTTD